MAADPSNPQYGAPQFGLDTSAYASTGSPGTVGDSAAQTEGPVIGDPVISMPYGSSQVPANMPQVPVRAGDTSGMSSDQAVGDNFSAIGGGSQAAMTTTGAGLGEVSTPPHPNARPGSGTGAP